MRRSPCSSAPARSTTATAASTWSRLSPSTSASTTERVHLACYFPMPFFRSARIELVGAERSASPTSAGRVRYAPFTRPGQPRRLLPRDLPRPSRTRSRARTWSCSTPARPKAAATGPGSFVGTSFIFSHRAVLNTLEGDPRFFFDDSQTPQAQGTGTEEWGGGGDYWGGRNMTLPFAGHPGRRAEREGGEERRGQDRVGLPLPAGRPDAVRQERAHPPGARRHERIDRALRDASPTGTARPRPSLVKTDELAGRRPGERAGARLRLAATPRALRDHLALRVGRRITLDGRGDLPARTRTGAGRTTGTSEFTLKLDPKNLGVLLRRKLDYAVPEPAGRGRRRRREPAARRAGRGSRPGVWYLAGSNTCVYSDPKDELGATQHVVQTSNRRFRDDEFLVPRDLTEGRSAIRVRVRFTPVERRSSPATRSRSWPGARSATTPIASCGPGLRATRSGRCRPRTADHRGIAGDESHRATGSRAS